MKPRELRINFEKISPFQWTADLDVFILDGSTLPEIERAIKCGIINTHAPINTQFRLENK